MYLSMRFSLIRCLIAQHRSTIISNNLTPLLVGFGHSSTDWIRHVVIDFKLLDRLRDRARVWLIRRSGFSHIGRLFARIACVGTKPFHQRSHFAFLTRRGFVAPGASVSDWNVKLGDHVYVGDGVVILRSEGGGEIEIGSHAHLYGNSFIESGSGGEISIGDNTHIQPGCHIHAHISNIWIGNSVEIAANCGFFSYNHGMALGELIMAQPLESTGGIVIGDGAWIGFGVTVLQGVSIGAGAIVGAGSLVNDHIPENAIAGGVPAKVLKYRTR